MFLLKHSCEKSILKRKDDISFNVDVDADYVDDGNDDDDDDDNFQTTNH